MREIKKSSGKPRMPYYRAYPRDFFEGTSGFSFELKAAYRLLMDLIYMYQGSLPDDAGYIAGHLGCSVRKWNSLRRQIIASGKILVKNGTITNHRASAEIGVISGLSPDYPEIISGSSQDNLSEKAVEINENNDLGGIYARGRSEPRTKNQKEDNTTNSSPTSAAREPMLLDRCLDAAGFTGSNAAPPGLMSIAPIYDLTQRGYDLEGDILPVIRDCAGKFQTWHYVTKVVISRVQHRNTIPEKPKPKPINWAGWMELYRKHGDWRDNLGPKPGEPGCLVPPEFLDGIEQGGSA